LLSRRAPVPMLGQMGRRRILGADGFIEKPFAVDALLALVEREIGCGSPAPA
jgi:hypothetical protein